MNKYSVNYTELENNLERQASYKYDDVKHRLEKVAFDIVRFRPEHDDIDGLWQIKATDDGEVIVAMYDESPKKEEDNCMKVNSSWDVILDKSGSTINIFYKNEPITRLASASLGISNSEMKSLCSDLPKKLASNKNLLNALLNDLSEQDRSALFTKYPELRI